MLTKIAVTAFLLPMASAHMMLGAPFVWGGNDGSLENPLNSGSAYSQWFCHGKSRGGQPAAKLPAGGQISIPVICGEAAGNPGNAPSTCSDDPNALHGGGGCALSISPKGNPSSLNDFYIFSVEHNCPNNFHSVTWNIPQNLPNGKYVCSWNWIPNPNNSADEMYMNCFDCEVTGGVNGATITGGAHPIQFAVPGSSAYGSRPMYKDKFSNGAQQIQTSAGGSQSSSSGGSSPAPSSGGAKGGYTTTQCGPMNGNKVCSNNMCCSKKGWCGTSYRYCGFENGKSLCESGYGRCDSNGGSSGGSGNKGNWEFCTHSSECANKCCNNKWSDDGKNKCTPGGCN